MTNLKVGGGTTRVDISYAPQPVVKAGQALVDFIADVINCQEQAKLRPRRSRTILNQTQMANLVSFCR